MAKEGETEVFRITTEIGKCYKHAESTRTKGVYPKERWFAPTNNVRYVGELVDIEKGGYGDNSWQTDRFRHNGTDIAVDYSYAGNTCFIEVPCKEKYKVDDIGVSAQAPANRKQNSLQSDVLNDYGLKGHIKSFLQGGKKKCNKKKKTQKKKRRKNNKTR